MTSPEHRPGATPIAGEIAEDDDWDGEECDGDDATTPCPYCGRPIYEDAPRCPHCERYVSAEDRSPTRKPWWVIAGLLACLLCVTLWLRG